MERVPGQAGMIGQAETHGHTGTMVMRECLVNGMQLVTRIMTGYAGRLTSLQDERQFYVERCLNPEEVGRITEIWGAMRGLGDEAIGKILLQDTVEQYQCLSGNPLTSIIEMSDEERKQFCLDLILAFDLIIDCLPNDIAQMPSHMVQFTAKHRLKGVVPYYAKMSLKHAFLLLLKKAVGPKAREPLVRTWSKFFEIFVQALIHSTMKQPQGKRNSSGDISMIPKVGKNADRPKFY